MSEIYRTKFFIRANTAQQIFHHGSSKYAVPKQVPACLRWYWVLIPLSGIDFVGVAFFFGSAGTPTSLLRCQSMMTCAAEGLIEHLFFYAPAERFLSPLLLGISRWCTDHINHRSCRLLLLRRAE